MKQNNVKFIGENKTYPQWDEKLTVETQREFEDYHKKLVEQGYSIKAANIAGKDGYLYWILKGESGMYLELYGELIA